MATTGLFGRHAELERLAGFLEGVREHGDARLICGDPGVGKSVLMSAAAELAGVRGMRVLRASGSEFEADVSYACLNQLFLPVHPDLERLPPGPREALTVALGLGAGTTPDVLLVCNAALLLVTELAADVPIVLLVDDVHWIDRASAVVLGFITRRLEGRRAGLLASTRAGTASFLDRRGLSEQVVEPLDSQAAGELVAANHPGMPARVRHRLLDLAQGNPLALIELPATLLGSAQRAVTQPEVVPLSDRLQAIFAARLASLPEPTRLLLLLATFESTGDVRVLRAALPDGVSLADLAPAERAQMVRVDDATALIAFRHPLIRSAIVALSTHEERRKAHAALAGALTDDRERRAWHLAAAAAGPDETVAELLEDTAHRVMLRGDAFAAIAALIRAAELSTTSAGRGRRLGEAAYIGAEASGGVDAESLLRDARRAAPDAAGSLHVANAAAFLMLNGDGDVNTVHRLLVGAIEAGDHGYRADDPALIEAVHTLLLVSWYGSTTEYWESFFRVLRRLQPEPPEVLALVSETFPDPVRTGSAALPRIDAILRSLADEADPTRIMRLGTASVYLDRLGDCRESSWRLVRQGRDGGPPRRHLGALMHLCLDDFLVGRWDEDDELALEGQRICDTSGFPFFAWYFRYNRALVAAGRGRFDEAYALADEITHWALPRGVSAAALFAHQPRTLAALGQGDYEAAFRHAAAMSPPGVLASHVPHCTWVMFDLVEAAVRTGRTVEARAHVEAMRAADVGALSGRMALIQAGAEALVLDGDEPMARLEALLAAGPATERWLFDASRVRLAAGERLRRTRSLAQARRHLLAACDGFAAMAAEPWLARTRAELRAAGHLPARQPAGELIALTAQERQIAQLAASGLTNKQIAERLYLSHRTIGAHLYRIFPKLGVTSRAGLRDALSPPVDGKTGR